MKTFMKQFNQTNNLKKELDEGLIYIFKRYLASTNSKVTIFDNQEKFDDIIESITSFVNPRKCIKIILSQLKKLIHQKSISLKALLQMCSYHQCH